MDPLPVTVVLDRNGNTVERFAGSAKEDDIPPPWRRPRKLLRSSYSVDRERAVYRGHPLEGDHGNRIGRGAN